MFKFWVKFSLLLLTVNFITISSKKRFAIIIPTYNNSAYCKANLYTLFSQDYDNYYGIIIDDNSKDNTYNKIVKYIKKFGKENKFKIIKNDKRKLKAANLYKVIHNYCDDNDIVVIYDGDDWLADKSVLSYLNEIYSTKDIWLTYGGYKTYPRNKKGFCRAVPQEVIESNNFRNYPRTSVSQLRTFYAWLYKQIPLKEFCYKGKFMPMTSDVAKMMPMFEMSGERIHFNRIVYIYNLNNSINDYKVNSELQHDINRYILSKKPFERLNKPIASPESNFHNYISDVIILIDKEEITNKLNYIAKKIKRNPTTGKIFIVTNSNLKTNNKELINTTNDLNLNELNKFITLITNYNNNIKLVFNTNFNENIKLLKKTKAKGISLSFNNKFFITEELTNNFSFCQYKYMEKFSPEVRLLRKKDLLKISKTKKLKFKELNEAIKHKFPDDEIEILKTK